MQTIVCDICKKKMDEPITNRTFFYFGQHGICEPCRDNLEVAVKPHVRSKEPFAMDWYRKLVSDTLDKATQKGKI